MRIGRVRVGISFILLVAWLNYLDRQMLVPLTLLACAVHEAGHLMAIWGLGGRIVQIRLSAVGAEIVLDRPMGYWQELVSTLAGPGANLLAAAAASRMGWGMLFAGSNLVLACFNMAPVPGLDGGRALRCVLALLAGPEVADRLGRQIGVLCAAVLLGAGGWIGAAGGNWSLMLVALWLAAASFGGNYSSGTGKRTCHRREKQLKYKERL